MCRAELVMHTAGKKGKGQKTQDAGPKKHCRNGAGTKKGAASTVGGPGGCFFPAF